MDRGTSFIAMWSLYVMESMIIEENKKRYNQKKWIISYPQYPWFS